MPPPQNGQGLAGNEDFHSAIRTEGSLRGTAVAASTAGQHLRNVVARNATLYDRVWESVLENDERTIK